MAEVPIQHWTDFRFEEVPIDNLFVDKAYQRRPTSLIQEIGDDYRPPLIQTLCVSARKESGRGEHRKVTAGAVFDGQQRLGGARLHNELVAKEQLAEDSYPHVVLVMPCIVYSGLSQQQEAQLFEWIQLKRRNMQSYDRFRASLVAGNEESLAIKDLVESTGYEIGYAGMSDRSIAAVAALEGMYRGDVIAMERSLIIFRGAWEDRFIPSSYQLRGMHRFLRDHPDVDDERLTRRMFITSPDDLEKKALNARELGGGKRSVADMVAAIRSIYGIRESQVERRLKAV